MAPLPPVIRRYTRVRGHCAHHPAVGIGANTAVFSVVNGVLIKPLPYPNAEELVGIWHSAAGLPNLPRLNVSPTMYFSYGENNRPSLRNEVMELSRTIATDPTSKGTWRQS